MTAEEGAKPAGPLFELLRIGRQRQASDLHVEPGQGAAYRIFTRIERAPETPISALDIDAFIEWTLDKRSQARLAKVGMADGVFADRQIGSLRIHASRGKSGTRLAIRFLARSIPDLQSLQLPPVIETVTTFRSGLILVIGPAGSGKTTTISSLLDRINATDAKHIITLEDPIEYTHSWLASVVTQYEVGRDVASFAEGVRGALRADPDVLFIGELRCYETVGACLQAAETGHLVFAALHTPSETSLAVNRIVGLFPSEEQGRARARLADALRAIVALRLIPLRDGGGLRAAVEVLVMTDASRRIVRDGTTHQLRSAIVASRREGSQTLEMHISELLARGEVDAAAAFAAAAYPDELHDLPASKIRARY